MVYTAYIWLIFLVNVGKSTTHGSYGLWPLWGSNLSFYFWSVSWSSNLVKIHLAVYIFRKPSDSNLAPHHKNNSQTRGWKKQGKEQRTERTFEKIPHVATRFWNMSTLNITKTGEANQNFNAPTDDIFLPPPKKGGTWTPCEMIFRMSQNSLVNCLPHRYQSMTFRLIYIWVFPKIGVPPNHLF